MNDDLPPVETDPQIDDAGPAPAPAAAPAQKPKKQGATNIANVGDIQVKKKAKTYNTYTLQLSMGQIQAIHSALSKDHANPVADELLALFDYYLQNVPGPGEEEEDIKAQDEQSAVNGDVQGGEGDEGEGTDDGLPIPMPPGYKGDGRTTVAGVGEEEPMGGEAGPGPGPQDDGPPSLPGGEDEGMPEEDMRLPAPPRE